MIYNTTHPAGCAAPHSLQLLAVKHELARGAALCAALGAAVQVDWDATHACPLLRHSFFDSLTRRLREKDVCAEVVQGEGVLNAYG